MSAAGPRRSGRESEDLALEWLEHRGLRRLARNYTCRLGEVDLIMQDHAHVVIVEVKFRDRRALVSGPESVTPAKQLRLIRTALHFLQRYPDLQVHPVRFDVLCVTKGERGPKIDWVRDAFQPRL